MPVSLRARSTGASWVAGGQAAIIAPLRRALNASRERVSSDVGARQEVLGNGAATATEPRLEQDCRLRGRRVELVVEITTPADS